MFIQLGRHTNYKANYFNWFISVVQTHSWSNCLTNLNWLVYFFWKALLKQPFPGGELNFQEKHISYIANVPGIIAAHAVQGQSAASPGRLSHQPVLKVLSWMVWKGAAPAASNSQNPSACVGAWKWLSKEQELPPHGCVCRGCGSRESKSCIFCVGAAWAA